MLKVDLTKTGSCLQSTGPSAVAGPSVVKEGDTGFEVREPQFRSILGEIEGGVWKILQSLICWG